MQDYLNKCLDKNEREKLLKDFLKKNNGDFSVDSMIQERIESFKTSQNFDEKEANFDVKICKNNMFLLRHEVSKIHTPLSDKKNLEYRIWRLSSSFNDADSILNLGLFMYLQNAQISSIDNALNTYAYHALLGTNSSGYDNSTFCYRAFLIAASNNFALLHALFPLDSIPSVSFGALECGLLSNLFIFTLYKNSKNPNFKAKKFQEIIDKQMQKALNKKKIWEVDKYLILCLKALSDGDFKGFSELLNDLCEAILKHDCKFKAPFALESLGLLNLARYIYPKLQFIEPNTENIVDSITLPTAKNFPLGLYNYQKERDFKSGDLLFKYPPPLSLLNLFYEINMPDVHIIRLEDEVKRDRAEMLEQYLKHSKRALNAQIIDVNRFRNDVCENVLHLAKEKGVF
ncbi:hypothetical protein DCO58_01990 [Helicobacter saguini]|uniref:Uncharacterized protein n=1 Tax=Helicobacter saguini TaxID=1548018 RepID=A0A347VRM3_9HELI|nr:hypothetical protein [Helicobacter saguini]MWV62849.1 hypothetical protein [Helicobacter saguini]MWV66480.1 hypothetical protein [Helicobacter saguini]MWV68830.1 hypothetical protein [Helicobacter saguini]MWV71615.1 hypothetical protein [Helicobacter saguini]TLD94420.1 hypothetical protein LS64_005685 [Helicobacter saguini]